MVKTIKYKSCEHVPCGHAPSTHNGCKPKYCYITKRNAGSSKNWSSCNMKNWFAKGTPRHTYQSSYCKTPKHVVKSKSNKIDKFQVDVMTLHNKMPYIWRFISPRTQKRMIVLAQLPLRTINAFPKAKDKKNMKRTKVVHAHLKRNNA